MAGFDARTQVATTQQTSKLWKAIQALGVLGILVCCTLGFLGINGVAVQEPVWPFLAAAAVFVPVWIFGRIGAWWFHG